MGKIFMKSYLSSCLTIISIINFTGCGSASNGSDFKSSNETIKSGVFKLYKTANAQPNPNCDIYTELKIDSRDELAVATLKEKADGACPMTPAENRRSYKLFIFDTSAAKKVYRDANTNPGLNAWRLEIEDYRFSAATNIQNLIVLHEKNSQDIIVDLYSPN